MTPQSSFMVLAPVAPAREAELRGLLAGMNEAPGRVNPRNTLVPFAQFGTLHVARFLLLDDKTLDDGQVYGLPRPTYPLYLAFLGDVDGDADEFLQEVARRAPEGLRTVFACCEGFAANGDLVGWMKRHSVPSAAEYVNWRGRTVRRVRRKRRCTTRSIATSGAGRKHSTEQTRERSMPPSGVSCRTRLRPGG